MQIAKRAMQIFLSRSELPKTVTLSGPPLLTIEIKADRRARRLALRVSAVGQGARLSVPQGTGIKTIKNFLKTHENWLRGALAKYPLPEKPDYGASIMIEGVGYTLTKGINDQISFDEDRMKIGQDPQMLCPRLKAYLIMLARARLVAASDKYVMQSKTAYTALSLRDPKTRWGSCSSTGRLMYSWRLIMAPPEVLDYVAAHEVAHLQHMNHSQAFWQMVKFLCPDYATQRRWLKINGAKLHRWVL